MDAGVLGKLLLAGGIAVALVGAFLMLGGRLPFGRLPGDISVQGQSGGFFFPIVSCIVISVVLTVVLNFIIRR
jgi:ABC-type tungstate transport system substrate-binding protein